MIGWGRKAEARSNQEKSSLNTNPDC